MTAQQWSIHIETPGYLVLNLSRPAEEKVSAVKMVRSGDVDSFALKQDKPKEARGPITHERF